MGKYREWNKGVPEETTMKYKIRDLQRQLGELASENAELKYQLEQKDRAISAFKKWQKKVVGYKYQYWMTEAIKLLDEQPEEKEWRTLFNLINSWNLFKTRYKTLIKNIKNIEIARAELVKMIEEKQININNALNEENYENRV